MELYEPSPFRPFPVLCTNNHFFDDAIDLTPPADPNAQRPLARVAEYRMSRDPRVLPLRSDIKPTVFVCKPIDVDLLGAIVAGKTDEERYALAFNYSCHEILLPDGKTLTPPGGTKPIGQGIEVHAPVQSGWTRLVSKRFGADTVQEVGSVIYQRARLPEHKAGPFDYPPGLIRGG